MKTDFHDYRHALEFDQRAARSDIRVQLGVKLIEALQLKGDEKILDLATGTGRFARPVARQLQEGSVAGLDQALAMLRVAREQKDKDPIPGYLQIAGDGESLPFREAVFHRAFIGFSLHHFGHPALMVREARRILSSRGSFVVLDPVLLEAEDVLDRALHDQIHAIFRRSHGENFCFFSARGIRELLMQEGFQITRAELHTFSIDQDSMEGIPTGRHWVEVAEHLQNGPSKLKRRFEERYLRYIKEGEKTRVVGSFGFALVCGEKLT